MRRIDDIDRKILTLLQEDARRTLDDLGRHVALSAPSVKRRLEVIGQAQDITVYDDFAHHPTAIHTTLEGLRAKVGAARIVVAMEPRSNSMRLGAHAEALAPSLDLADAVVFLHRPELAWDAAGVIAAVRGQAHAVPDTDALLARLGGIAAPGDHVVFMSNGGFDGAPRRLPCHL